MGYIVALIILIIGTLLGQLVLHFCQLEKSKHALVYGLFVYFAGFFIVSGPFSFFSLPWNWYFVTMTLYHVVLLGFFLYGYMKKIIRFNFSFEHLIEYLRANWFVIGMIVLFTVLNFASYNAWRFSGNYSQAEAIVDDFIYLSRAAKNIGHTIYPMGIDVSSGVQTTPELLLLVSFLELFWGYMSQLFQIDLVVFTRTTMSIVMYVWIFYAFDEMLYVMFDKKKYQLFKYTILAFGLLYYVNNMQSEVYKFMYLPWFGSVFSTILYIPLLLLFFFQSLAHKKSLVLLFLLPFISVGFSPVNILYTAILFFPIMMLWYKNKAYESNDAKQLLYVSFGLFSLFLFVSIMDNFSKFSENFLMLINYSDLTRYSEMAFFKSAFVDRLMFIIPGLAIFFYRVSLNKVRPIEKWMMFFVCSILLISLMPRMNVALFNLFSFPYRRFWDSLLIGLVFYSWAMILLVLGKLTLVRFVGTLFAFSLVFYQVPGFYFLSNYQFFSIENIFKEKRLPEASEELAIFFKQSQQQVNVCLAQDPLQASLNDPRNPQRIVMSNDGTYSIDLGSGIATLPNVYAFCQQAPDNMAVQYYVVTNSETIYREIGAEHLRLVKEIVTDELTLEIYQYV